MMPKVSVIIPVFNAEKYIGECLNSLLNQTYNDYEIICVDDGSTDNTLSILQEYQKVNKCISVIHQENQYAGVARNNGMKIAKGKYLLFVDADDFCERTMIQELVDIAEKDNIEILVFDLYQYNDKTKSVQNLNSAIFTNFFGEGIKSAKEINNSIFQFTIPGPMNKLFLRKFILDNNLLFQNLPRTNDLYFVYAALSYAEKISVYNKKLEYYRIENDSSLQATNDRSPLAFIEALHELKSNLVKRNVYDLFEKSFKQLVINVFLFNLSSQKKKETFLQILDALKNKTICEMQINENQINDKVVANILNRILQSNVKITIYGAGVLAKILIKYFSWVCGVEKERINIVVTKKDSNEAELYGIKIMDVEKYKKESNTIYFVAVNNNEAQLEIVKNLENLGINSSIIVGFGGMLAILMGECA